jgi:hypothetical protein
MSSVDFQRWIALQHAAGRSDADIAAGFETLSKQIQAAGGDKGKRDDLDAKLAKLADQDNAAVAGKLHIVSNNGRQGIPPAKVVESWLKGGRNPQLDSATGMKKVPTGGGGGARVTVR